MIQPEDRFERIQALAKALDPLIDYCLAHGIHTAELESMLRVQFVKRAESVLPGSVRLKGRPSHEAIGLAAGLNRGEVQRILSTGNKGAALRMRRKWEKHTTSEKLLAIWEEDRRFVSNADLPLDLPLDSQEGGPSFTELVEHALPGKKPHHVLKELRRRGLVEQLANEIIRYRRSTGTTLPGGKTEALEYAAEQMSLLGHTLLQSIANGKSSREFRNYAASAPVEIPVSELQQLNRPDLLQRMGMLTQLFKKEYKLKIKNAKSAKKKIPTLKVGICIFTWQSK